MKWQVLWNWWYKIWKYQQNLKKTHSVTHNIAIGCNEFKCHVYFFTSALMKNNRSTQKKSFMCWGYNFYVVIFLRLNGNLENWGFLSKNSKKPGKPLRINLPSVWIFKVFLAFGNFYFLTVSLIFTQYLGTIHFFSILNFFLDIFVTGNFFDIRTFFVI